METIIDGLLARRDRERAAVRRAALVISAEDARLESSPLGVQRWYLYPGQDNACIKSLQVYRYEIPPDGHTGRLRWTGNLAAYVLSGAGHVVVNGERHDWEVEDVVGIPTLPGGVDVQFFNTSGEEAHIICAEPNFVELFGVDGGSGFEILEPASTWQ